jgi:Family of unknown function (DUF5397)
MATRSATMATTLAPADRWRRLGPVGPIYEVLDTPGLVLADGDRKLRIRVLESGEEADYRLSDILDDPLA